MINLKIKIPKLEKFIELLDKYPSLARERFTEATNRALDVWYGSTLTWTPYRTGKLASSIKKKTTFLSGELYTNLEYAPYVYFGTRAYWIYPRVKQALWWPGADHPVKKAYHPAITGIPFFELGQRETEDAIEAIYLQALNAVLEDITKI